MKTLTIIFIVLLTSTIRSQNVPDSVFAFTFLQLQASRDSVKILKMQNSNLRDTILPNLNRQLYRDSIQLANCNKITDIALQPEEKKHIPFLRWDGFFIGAGTGIIFDSVVVKSSLLSRLSNQLYIFAKPRILIGDNFCFEGILKIPFQDNIFVGAEVGYKIF